MRERAGPDLRRERLEAAEVVARVPVQCADAEGLRVIPEVHRPAAARRGEILVDRPHPEPRREKAGEGLHDPDDYVRLAMEAAMSAVVEAPVSVHAAV